jgi:hypothetical protein
MLFMTRVNQIYNLLQGKSQMKKRLILEKNSSTAVDHIIGLTDVRFWYINWRIWNFQTSRYVYSILL